MKVSVASTRVLVLETECAELVSGQAVKFLRGEIMEPNERRNSVGGIGCP